MQFDLQAWRHQDKRGVIPSGAAFQAKRGISLRIEPGEIPPTADGCPMSRRICETWEAMPTLCDTFHFLSLSEGCGLRTL
jgi:hypothetical protein